MRLLLPPWRWWTAAAAVLLVGMVAWAWAARRKIDPAGCWRLAAGAGAERGIFHPPPEIVRLTDDHLVRPSGPSRARARIDTLFVTRWRKDLRGRLVIEHTNTYRGVLVTLDGAGDTLRGQAHTFDDLAFPGARPGPWPVAANRVSCD